MAAVLVGNLAHDVAHHFGISAKEIARLTNQIGAQSNSDADNLEKDVDFGFEKALNQRGLSAGMMHDVVCMWNWILEVGLEDFDEYAQYGLPTFKATAIKYGFANPIGDDAGNEERYASD